MDTLRARGEGPFHPAPYPGLPAPKRQPIQAPGLSFFSYKFKRPGRMPFMKPIFTPTTIQPTRSFKNHNAPGWGWIPYSAQGWPPGPRPPTPHRTRTTWVRFVNIPRLVWIVPPEAEKHDKEARQVCRFQRNTTPIHGRNVRNVRFLENKYPREVL
jgi:hypothetical protein